MRRSVLKRAASVFLKVEHGFGTVMLGHCENWVYSQIESCVGVL